MGVHESWAIYRTITNNIESTELTFKLFMFIYIFILSTIYINI